jgi:hypothetical protein
MVVDEYGLCPPHQVTPVAIGSDLLTLGMYPPDVQSSRNIFPYHADHIFTMDEHAKIVPMNYSEHGYRGSGLPVFGLSGVILQASEHRNERNSIAF